MPRLWPSRPRASSIRQSRTWLILAGLGLGMLALAWLGKGHWQAPGERVGLFTSLAVMWSDSPDLGADLRPEAETHWVRTALEQRGKIEPLDSLEGLERSGLRRLVIAQPRPLSPQENVALDGWLRQGGHLLLLVDPMLTEDSGYSVGDPRRPQAIALLSPILQRWGLELRYDDSQALGEADRDVLGVATPVNLPGHFVLAGNGNCRLWAQGLAVTCAIGKGRLVALADAAVLERSQSNAPRQAALSALLDTAFAAR